jgi:hypothetical protein
MRCKDGNVGSWYGDERRKYTGFQALAQRREILEYEWAVRSVFIAGTSSI